ncbi:MAG: M14 family metallopeptidase [Planctomycetaceae bacterium]
MTTILRHEFHSTEHGPRVLITAGVHGDEFESIAAVHRLRELFACGSPRVAGYRGTVTLVPVANDAAYRRGRRTADDGLDLARVCPGRADGSTTERIACELSELIRAADYYIDLHTGGTELSVLPLAGYMLHADLGVLESQRRMATAFGLPVVWGTTAELAGRTLSVARDAGVPAIYAEYGGAATCDPKGVSAYVDGCLNVLAEVGCLSRSTSKSRVEHFVEDGRPSSGHLQIQNPSPAAGVFTPAIRLGEFVSPGDDIGVVFDPLEGNERVIRSRQEGLVLVLRTFPRVQAGDSLCVVLECERPGSHNPPAHNR